MRLDIHIHGPGAARAWDRVLTALTSMETRIMSAITDFAAKQKEHNDAIATGIDGISADLQGLNDKIVKLQNSPGAISAEDQATLDELENAGAALAERVKAVDDLTPPVVPAG